MTEELVDGNEGAAAVLERDEPFGDVGQFHASLADFCAAEMPMSRALEALDDELPRGQLRDDCAVLVRELEKGTPFAEAYASRRRSMPPVYRALVEAGVESGDIEGVLREIAVDASLRERVRDTLRRRLEYPLIAAGVVLAIGAVVTLVIAPVIPDAATMLNIHDSSAGPLFTKQRAVDMRWIAMALVGLGVAVALAVAIVRRPVDPGAGPRGVLFRVPFIGRLRSYAAKAGFASTMALLLRREIPLPRALELCASGCDSARVREQIERMAKQADQGETLTASIRAGDLIPGNLLWFVESAGSSEASAKALEDIGAIYRQRLGRATDRVAAFAMPVLELLIGFVVLAFAMTYITPAYQVLVGTFR